MRAGLYVNGRRYSFEQRAQAIARAEFLAGEYGRDVTVHTVDHAGRDTVAHCARFTPTVSTNLLAIGSL